MSEVVRLPAPLAHEIVGYCLEERPNEACGLLATRDGEVIKVFRMTNAAASPLRYELDPREQLAVQRKIDEEGWQLGGVFHSHTRTSAYPSPTDIRLAFEDVPYVIVSLATEPAALKAFRIRKRQWTDETGEVVEVPISITEAERARD